MTSVAAVPSDPIIGPAPATGDGRGYLANGKLSHLPPLDGIRGLGIPFVFLYHHEAIFLGRKFGGGILTVSMFFTLSGFLIARLLVEEHRKNATIDVKRFYQRRFRRLMPAALVTLLVIAQVWWLAPPANGGISFRAWFAALTYWENWHLIFAGRSYSQLFADASPLQHMWSLSIEEQVYVVFPVLMYVLFRSDHLRAQLDKILFALAALGFALGGFWAARAGNERAYYALEARAAEFMLGAAFAVWWMRAGVVPRIATFMRSTAGYRTAAATLAVQVAMWYLVGLHTTGLFPVWVVVNGLLTCVVMGYASADAGVTRFLSWRPFVFIGRISYGLYIVHWPIFLFFDHERFPVTGWLLLTIRLAATFAAALLLFHLVENPVRIGQMWKGLTFWVACALFAVFGAGFAWANEPSTAAVLVDDDAVAAQQRALDSLPLLGADAPTNSVIDTTLPARVLVVGDSQAWAIGGRFAELWGTPNGVDVQPSPGVGCGVGEPTEIEYLGVVYANGRDGCQEWRDALPKIVEKFQPQLVMVIGGFGDVADHRLEGSDEWVHIGEPVYDTWLEGQMAEFTDVITSSGAEVLWFSSPHVRPPRPAGTDPYPEEDPARVDLYNEMIVRLAELDDRVEYADLATFVAARPGGEFDPTFRPDGAHIDLTVAPDLVAWLDEQVRRVTG
jgi:peptidoglycan/LPS O-acetylase OafA/YrhL